MIYLINSSMNEIAYQTRDSSGFDICANEDVEIAPGDTVKVKTGLYLGGQIERGKEPLLCLQLMSRSSLAMKGLVVAQGTGNIDADYRDEIAVILHNRSNSAITVKVGDRVAQGLFTAVFNMPGVPIKDVERIGGLGSTN
jgi:dUTP pyrophosphatase